jgi:hypothetical protein
MGFGESVQASVSKQSHKMTIDDKDSGDTPMIAGIRFPQLVVSVAVRCTCETTSDRFCFPIPTLSRTCNKSFALPALILEADFVASCADCGRRSIERPWKQRLTRIPVPPQISRTMNVKIMSDASGAFLVAVVALMPVDVLGPD